MSKTIKLLHSLRWDCGGNLGGVMGVALSSWIFQSSLRYQLEYRVTGIEKGHIVALVGKSAQTIAELDPVHRLAGMLDWP